MPIAVQLNYVAFYTNGDYLCIKICKGCASKNYIDNLNECQVAIQHIHDRFPKLWHTKPRTRVSSESTPTAIQKLK